VTSFIYIIAAEKTGPCKVGYSADPSRRLRQLQTGQSSALTLYHREEIEDDRVRLMEQIVHRENRHRKLKGEWFDLTVEEAVAEIKHAMIRFDEESHNLARYRTRM